MFFFMTKVSKIFVVILVLGALPNCSKVLQTVQLELNDKDTLNQEEFTVLEKTLTIKEAKRQNQSPYKRTILQPGKGAKARSIPEDLALISTFPNSNKENQYKIGVGDILSFSRLIENASSEINVDGQWPLDKETTTYKLGIGDTIALKLIKEDNDFDQNVPISDDNQNLIVNNSTEEPTINSSGRIGSDGSVLLLEVGSLEAKGKTLSELRSEVRNILIRNGVTPRFQLEILEFKSQRAYLTVNSSSQVIVLDDQKTTLRDVLTAANVGLKPGKRSLVRLQRENKKYLMTLRKIFHETAPKIFINNRDHIFVEDSSSSIAETRSVVDPDGKIVLEGVGSINAAGLSIKQLKEEISSKIEKLPDSKNAFQITISEALSQKATVNIFGKEGGIIPITNTPIALDQILTQNGLSVDGEKITRIKLQRNKQSYSFTLDDLLKRLDNRLYLEPGDLVTTETLSYKENKVFILGGINPQIYKINPTIRETLADVLFTNNGVLSSSSAKRSEVYLLRGNSPVTAFHLDAQNPTRLIVADAMELRPNDILYVAEQPIISFNRTLATVIPLRLLLRDIQDENIP